MPGRRVPEKPKVRACAVLEAKARAVYRELLAGIEEPEITLAVLRDVRDRTGAIWYMRDREQDARQTKKDAWVKKYRPIQTLDGLDPHPRHVAIREIDAALSALGRAFRG